MSDRTGVPSSIPNRYVGPQADIVPIKRFPRRPLTTDKKYPVGQFALLGKSPSTGVAGELWYLSEFSSGNAIWIQFAGGAGAPGIDFLLTDDGAPAVGPDGDGITDILGGTGIVTSGQDPATAVTIDVTATVPLSFPTDSGTATPAANALTIAGGTGLNTSGSGSTVTVNMDASSSVSAFFGYLSSSVTNVTGDSTAYYVALDAETFDTGGDFNIATGIFTAPQAGIYYFTCQAAISNLAVGHTTWRPAIHHLESDGTTLVQTFNFAESDPNGFVASAGTLSTSGSCIFNMASGETCRLKLVVSGSTKTVTANGSSANSNPKCVLAGCLLA